MKKTIISILIALLCFTSFGFISNVQAAGDKPKENILYLSAKIPGAKCENRIPKGQKNGGLYKCTITSGFGSIMLVMGKLLKYFTFIAGLLAVLMLVVGGIMYSMGGADESMKTKSKEFITKSLMGLVLLLMSGTILYAVAPWVYV